MNDYERVIMTIGWLKPKFLKDGNMFCFLYGENLADGIAGFGETPFAAADNFLENFLHETIKGGVSSQ